MDTSLFISILSLLISSITLILNFPRISRERKGKLNIKAVLSDDRKQINIQIKNASFNRIIQILEFEIYYGSMPDYKQFVVRETLDTSKVIKLTESDTATYSISTEKLIPGAIENKVTQRFYSVLWVRTITAISGNPLTKVETLGNYFSDKKYAPALRYMIADDLLGFQLMQPDLTKKVGNFK